MIKNIFFGIFALLLGLQTNAQDIEPENGVINSKETVAFTNARIVVSATETIERGTLVIKDGVIINVGVAVIAPKNAIKIDLKGYTLYPSFIDIHASEGVEKSSLKKKGMGPQLSTLKEGPYYWNQSIHPEVDAYTLFKKELFKEKDAYIKQGFGTISTHQNDGLLRGTSVLTTIGSNTDQEQIIKTRASNHYSFSKGSSKQSYPSSQMGAIALIRQFFYDAKWYSTQSANTDNISLNRAIENLDLPQIFEVSNKLEILRAAKLAKEFNIELIIKGGGDSYERIDEIKALGTKLIIPVNFPDPYDVTDPYLSRFVSLADLKDWEMRPYNAYFLHQEQVPFCFTTAGLKKKTDFLKNIRKTVKHGLPKSEALRALTENPAAFLNVDDQVGTLEAGKIANLLIVKGDLFENGVIYENWIRGKRTKVKDIALTDIRGKYNLNINSIVYGWEVTGSIEKPKSKLLSYRTTMDSVTNISKQDTAKLSPNLVMNDLQISMNFAEKGGNLNGVVQLNGTYNSALGAFHGKAKLPNGDWVDWSAIRNEKHKDSKKTKSTFKVDTSAVDNLMFPNMAYGFDSLPSQETYFIKNATIWTNEAGGILKNATLLIQDGKIKAVNKSIIQIPNDAIIIDAEGKHVTSGIIDEHSHIAISKGVNESGQNNSAEVSIADVVRSNDINIYRQLSGGVTASQLLHGSANPVGGQSAMIKLKWGFSPAEMLIDDAPGFIKFALGENVKQSNWGNFNTVRFPQTRMGVEQVFYDAFIQAKQYEQEWKTYSGLSEKKRIGINAPRRDLELDVMVEILNSERFVTCHSYIQSEINMLMHVADSMGFTLNTFTHILEGYKVAEQMKAHGAGASTFADWWAYKYEVNEAIPYNAAILHKMGIVTAINSDDAEMGRRLNHEAAKVVKYGGISEEDAWKMVTLNPAILLHLDEEMGSIKVGKDADIVIWSDNPLSIQAKVEQTFVDGMLLYDWNRSVLLHDRDQVERNRIMQLMLAEKKAGVATRKPFKKMNPHYHCDTVGEH
ncbi:MAG: imidazolonepropionase-like amidohydrolase [Crocinitomix sp.]|jgi:imidazolonepropionase-like amidohydrolase